MNPNTLRIAAASVAVLSLTGIANAKYICGLTQMRHYGIHDNDFRLAKHWAAALPHTTAHAGAVVVQSRKGRDSAGNPGGHVSRIVEMRGNCTALVADDRGTHMRDICSRLIAYVDPNGNSVEKVRYASLDSDDIVSHSRHRVRHHRHLRGEKAVAVLTVDRLTMH